MVESVVRHYEHFLAEHEWLAYGSLGWTVCFYEGKKSRDIEEQVIRALSQSGHIEHSVMSVLEEPLYVPGVVVFYERLAQGIFLLEVEESYVSESRILRVLSEKGSVWNASWNAGYHSRFTYSEEGIVIYKWSDIQFSATPPVGAAQCIAEVVNGVMGLCRMENRHPSFADLLAIMDLSTGVTLANDWLDKMRPCYIIRDPLPRVGWAYE